MSELAQFFNETRTSLTNQATQLRNLEVQMGKMTSMFNFPSTSKVNPRRDSKEHCKAITIRSGKTIERPAQICKTRVNLNFSKNWQNGKLSL